MRWIVGGLLALAAWCAAAHVRSESGIAFDEPKRIASGLTLLEHRAFASQDGTPLSIAFAMPFSPAERAVARTWDPDAVRSEYAIWKYGLEFLTQSGPPDALSRARLSTLLAFGLLLAIVAWEGRRMAGPSGLVAAVALAAVSPALLSHAGLASPDLFATTAAVAFCVALRSFLARGGTGRFAGVAVLAGVTIAAKLTCIAVVGGACAAAFIAARRQRLRIGGAALAAALGVVLADAMYRAFGSSLREPMDAARAFAGSPIATYFLGGFGDPGPSFYPVLALGKATPLLLASIALAPIVMRFEPARRATVGAAWIAYGLPALALLGALVVSDYPQGYRFLLPVFALLGLAATPTLAGWLDDRSRAIRVATWSVIAAQTLAVGVVHPNHLAYWNVFVGGSDGGSRIAVDSNCDWGQATPALRRYADSERLGSVFSLLNTIEPLGAPLVGLPALASHLATGESLDRCAIAVSTTYVRTAEIAGVRESNPLFEFVHVLNTQAPHATPGHAIHVWRFTPEVEALAREHLGKYLQR